MTTALATRPAADVTLDEKYELASGWTFMSGTQALVRLPLQQRLCDVAAGRNTAGFISGYRGSPLGRYDMELWRNAERLKAHHIHFQPGVNEDLAATAVWGSQYVGIFPGARYDGVFSIWYGKTPGVDRSADVLRHANAAGTAPWGGALALCGDDHAAKSSTQAAQSDQILIATGIPVLYPANVQDILDFGLHGIAMSRHAGCWVGLKLVTDVVESSGSVQVGVGRPHTTAPAPLPTQPADGLNIRRFDGPLPQEARLYEHKLHAALEYARANGLNRVALDSAAPRLGIVAAGKSYADVRQALLELGLDEAAASAHGIRLLKVGMVWPLDPHAIEDFAQGLETLLVVEEKRNVLEDQVKAILFDAPGLRGVRVAGKYHGANGWARERGAPGLPSTGELAPPAIAALVARLLGLPGCEGAAPAAVPKGGPVRLPNFCSGCPHNTSTQLPEGSRALAGIGCHAIASLQRPQTTGTISHMGGEGVMWVGQAPFTDEPHVFANLGDGTYFHSGFLAIRQAVAAKVRITYKLLVNGFVSMTGGQPVDGELSMPQMAAELLAEGVGRIVVVADDPGRYDGVALPPGVAVEHRRALERVQRELREFTGVSVLIYDQVCATERRRLRKRGKVPDPEQRSFINSAVCEGCGDCSAKSNCMSIEPLPTELGRKRRINQSSCNKDFSCVEGFCPSFVTVHGATPRRGKARALPESDLALPEAALPALDGARPYGVLVTGIGGTGVVTVGAILGMAAHLDGKGVVTQDAGGLAQKGGATWSHIQIAHRPDAIYTTKVDTAKADLVIGCDSIVAANKATLAVMQPGRTFVALNTHGTPTATFVRNPDWQFPTGHCESAIAAAVGAELVGSFDAEQVAVQLLGDSIYTNPLMLGYAWQKGRVPLTHASLMRAMELNGVQVENNKAAFEWGRRCAHDLAAVQALFQAAQVIQLVRKPTLADMLAQRVEFLTGYQNAAYAAQYQAFVHKVQAAEAQLGSSTRLAEAVARYLFKLMAYKDEYEVARLHTDKAFTDKIAAQFEGDYKLVHHLAPPLMAQRNSKGELVKRPFGPWMRSAFGLLARMKGLRGTAFDIFGKTEERRTERALIQQYRACVEELLQGLTPERLALAVQIASIPEDIRGYGHVKERHLQAARARWDALMAQWRGGASMQRQAA